MMKPQCCDWISGYLIAKFEKYITTTEIDSSCTSTAGIYKVTIPKLWLGMSRDLINNLRMETLDIIYDMFPNSPYKYKIGIVESDKKQYMDFVLYAEPNVREMTIKEIEEKLGYKIKIVEDR